MTWADQVGRLRTAAFSTFNEAVSYLPPAGSVTPPEGVPIALQGIYRDDPIAIEVRGVSSVQSMGPSLDVRRDDITGGPQQDARVTVRGESFEVWNVEGPDDVGICRLTLKRV